MSDPSFYDYRARVQFAAQWRGREMVTIRCPRRGCHQRASGAVYDSPLGPLYEATVPFGEFVADLINLGEPHDKHVNGSRVPYPTRDVCELLDEAPVSDFDAACQRGHVGKVAVADVLAAVDRYRSFPSRPAELMHMPEDSASAE